MFSSRGPAGSSASRTRMTSGKSRIVKLTAAVVAAAAGRIQPAAEVHNGRIRVRAQIVPHLKGQIVLAHGDLQKTEALHQAPGLFLQRRKIIVDLPEQADGRLVPVKIRIQLRAHFPRIERDDQGLLYGIFLNFVVS